VRKLFSDLLLSVSQLFLLTAGSVSDAIAASIPFFEHKSFLVYE